MDFQEFGEIIGFPEKSFHLFLFCLFFVFLELDVFGIPRIWTFFPGLFSFFLSFFLSVSISHFTGRAVAERFRFGRGSATRKHRVAEVELDSIEIHNQISIVFRLERQSNSSMK